MESLFVYGTLGPGRPNAHILENIGGTWQEG
ncbi:gamma-glutamylcyclotransferase family protein, partial [Klebsiella pneumoniae]